MKNIEIYSDINTISEILADEFIRLSDKRIQKYGRFSAALAGGSTPKPFYRALGNIERQEKINWRKIHLFWGDERCVPPGDPESNYRMVREELLSKIAIPEENVYRVPAELEPRLAAFKYEATLRSFFGGVWPQFDLVLLGMGQDGHTASLFPNSIGLFEEQRWFIPNVIPETGKWRLTLTKTAINAARNIWVIVSGASKADMLAGKVDPELKPIQFIAPVEGKLTWFVDQATSHKLPDHK